jgi:aspartyl-tRNA(Asn)/glutamyl-tRNA(Gln) amidotransferase subunit B
MRSKEEAEDYRYFPDPDLLPLRLTEADHAEARATLPELPAAKRARYEETFGLSAGDARLLAADRATAAYFEAALAAGAPAKAAANWLTGEIAAYLNREGVNLEAFPLAPEALAGLIARVEDGTLSSKLAKTVFERMLERGEAADLIIERDGLKQVSDTGALDALVQKVIAENPDQVAQYRAGKGKVLGFFVGQLMKASGGKANPQQLNSLLKAALGAPGDA